MGRRISLLQLMVAVVLLLGALATGRWLSAARVQAADPLPPARFDEPILPATPYEYVAVPLPDHFNAAAIVNADNTPVDNPVTNAGATLGRVLFYDVRLSANNTVSCASCHVQQFGFADPDQFSQGFDGGFTDRNAPGLANGRWYERGHFFYDERAETLEAQVLMPIQDPVEMGMTLPGVISRLEATSFYADLFDDAFGSPDITSERMSLAMAQFVRAMVSYQTKFDAGVPIDFANFTPQEELGREIFQGEQGRCSRCHITDIHITGLPHNVGLDATTTDPGVGGITGETWDMGLFKSPSLRNVAMTAPYMHDGRFATLEEVVAFYNDGVQPHVNLDPALKGMDGTPLRLNLTAEEQAALVAYMRTLTDVSLLTDPKFSDPFLAPTAPLYLPSTGRGTSP